MGLIPSSFGAWSRTQAQPESPTFPARWDAYSEPLTCDRGPILGVEAKGKPPHQERAKKCRAYDHALPIIGKVVMKYRHCLRQRIQFNQG